VSWRERERELRESDEQTIDISLSLFLLDKTDDTQRIINKTAPAVRPVSYWLVGWPSAAHQPLVPLQQHVGIQKEKSIALLAEKKTRK
jgi:hypothetical protein